MTMSTAIVTENTTTEDRSKEFSRLSAARTFAGIVGPSLGSFLYQRNTKLPPLVREVRSGQEFVYEQEDRNENFGTSEHQLNANSACPFGDARRHKRAVTCGPHGSRVAIPSKVRIHSRYKGRITYRAFSRSLAVDVDPVPRLDACSYMRLFTYSKGETTVAPTGTL